jgi:hypothetical protein
MNTCIYCGKQIRAAFVRCRHCGFSCCSEKCFNKHVTSHAGEPLPRAQAKPKQSSLFPACCAVVFLSLFGCCGGFLALGFWASRQQSLDIAEADRLYAAGQQEEAVAIYKKYPSRLLDADGKGLDGLRRVIEFEASKGHTAEAKSWIDRALDKRLQVTFESPEAQQLLAALQQERAQASARDGQAATGKAPTGALLQAAAPNALPPKTARSDPSPQERAARAAEQQAENERFEKEMLAYRRADAEYDAARKVKQARTLTNDALEEQARGHRAEADRLREKAEERYREIVARYPGTQGAADAQALLDGKDPEVRRLPPLPVPPQPPSGPAETTTQAVAKTSAAPTDAQWVLVQGEEGRLFDPNSPASSVRVLSASGESRTVTVYGHRASATTPEFTWLLLREADARALAESPAEAPWGVAAPSATAGRPKTVLVHGYYRRNGTFVQSHARSAPGGWSAGGGRRR